MSCFRHLDQSVILFEVIQISFLSWGRPSHVALPLRPAAALARCDVADTLFCITLFCIFGFLLPPSSSSSSPLRQFYTRDPRATCSLSAILMRLHAILRKLLLKYPAQLLSATKSALSVVGTPLHCQIMCDSCPCPPADIDCKGECVGYASLFQSGVFIPFPAAAAAAAS